jgi:hypothetical protein
MRFTFPVMFSVAFMSYLPQRVPADTFGLADLPAAERLQVLAAVRDLAYDTPASWTEELQLKRIDLGGSRGLVVRGTNLLCGGTGNCQLFVFRRVNGQWVSLFRGGAPIADTYVFGPGATNGVRDLVITANVSAEQSKRTVYKFNGTSYEPLSGEATRVPSAKGTRRNGACAPVIHSRCAQDV